MVRVWSESDWYGRDREIFRNIILFFAYLHWKWKFHGLSFQKVFHLKDKLFKRILFIHNNKLCKTFAHLFIRSHLVNESKQMPLLLVVPLEMNVTHTIWSNALKIFKIRAPFGGRMSSETIDSPSRAIGSGSVGVGVVKSPLLRFSVGFLEFGKKNVFTIENGKKYCRYREDTSSRNCTLFFLHISVFIYLISFNMLQTFMIIINSLKLLKVDWALWIHDSCIITKQMKKMYIYIWHCNFSYFHQGWVIFYWIFIPKPNESVKWDVKSFEKKNYTK